MMLTSVPDANSTTTAAVAAASKVDANANNRKTTSRRRFMKEQEMGFIPFRKGADPQQAKELQNQLLSLARKYNRMC